MIHSSLLLSTLCAALPPAAPTPAAPSAAPSLQVSLRPTAVRFQIEQATDAPFLGVVLVSLRGDTALPGVGLPPVLQEHTIVGFGASEAEGRYTLDVGDHLFLPGVPLYAQGVTYDERAFRSTDVASFVLDAGPGF